VLRTLRPFHPLRNLPSLLVLSPTMKNVSCYTIINLVVSCHPEPVFSLEADIHIDGLKSGSIYGFREASILPVKRSKKTPSAVSDTQRIATPTTVTKAHKATFSEGASHYIWSDWIYVVIS
jgi:hypothetical protein